MIKSIQKKKAIERARLTGTGEIGRLVLIVSKMEKLLGQMVLVALNHDGSPVARMEMERYRGKLNKFHEIYYYMLKRLEMIYSKTFELLTVDIDIELEDMEKILEKHLCEKKAEKEEDGQKPKGDWSQTKVFDNIFGLNMLKEVLLLHDIRLKVDSDSPVRVRAEYKGTTLVLADENDDIELDMFDAE
jgi:hypothetical protein